jgi:hypothetical protein
MLDVVCAGVVLHTYVGLVALVVTLAVPFGVVQLVLSVLLHVADGGAVVLNTCAEQVLVQPVLWSVTVTV